MRTDEKMVKRKKQNFFLCVLFFLKFIQCYSGRQLFVGSRDNLNKKLRWLHI